MHVVATYQWTNKVALVAGTRLVNFQASAATLLSADLLRPLTELPSKLGRESAIYINKISMVITLSNFCLIKFLSTSWATQLYSGFLLSAIYNIKMKVCMYVCVYVRRPAAELTQPITPKFGMGSSFHPGSAPSQGATRNVDPRPPPHPPPRLLPSCVDHSARA